MSKTPNELVVTNMSTIITLSNTIETECDAQLTSDFDGNPILVDIDSDVVGLTQVEENVLVKLLKIKYPKWSVAIEGNASQKKFLKFVAVDYTA